MDERPAGGVRFLLLVVLFVLIAGGVAYFVRQGALGTSEPNPQQESHPTATAREPDAEPATPQVVTVHVDSVPRGAQVLLEVPEAVREVRVERDVAHEFVAVYGDGRARRLVVPAGRTPVEADLQPHDGADVGAELGPSRLEALPTEASGDIARVVRLRAPKDARIFKLVGLTPADVQLSPQTSTATFMLYRRGYAKGTLTATSEELEQSRGAVDGGAPALALSARLSPLS